MNRITIMADGPRAFSFLVSDDLARYFLNELNEAVPEFKNKDVVKNIGVFLLPINSNRETDERIAYKELNDKDEIKQKVRFVEYLMRGKEDVIFEEEAARFFEEKLEDKRSI